MSCSLAECQCHGILHPALVFARITDAPFDGSRFCTEPLMHVGSPGKFTNLLVALAAWTILSSARADLNPGPASTANSRQQLQKRMSILLKLNLADGSIAASAAASC